VLLSPLTLARDGMHLAGQSRDTYLGSTVDRKNILGLELLLLQKPKSTDLIDQIKRASYDVTM